MAIPDAHNKFPIAGWGVGIGKFDAATAVRTQAWQTLHDVRPHHLRDILKRNFKRGIGWDWAAPHQFLNAFILSHRSVVSQQSSL
jgi:hypothetical protein